MANKPTYGQWYRREAQALETQASVTPSTALPDTVSQKHLADVVVAKTAKAFKDIEILTIGNLADRMHEHGLYQSETPSGVMYLFAKPEASQIKATPAEAVQHWAAVLSYCEAMGVNWKQYVRNLPQPAAPPAPSEAEKPVVAAAKNGNGTDESWTPPKPAPRPEPNRRFPGIMPLGKLRQGYKFRLLQDDGTRLDPHIWMVVERNHRGEYLEESEPVTFEGIYCVRLTDGYQATFINRGMEVQYLANEYAQIMLQIPNQRELIYGVNLLHERRIERAPEPRFYAYADDEAGRASSYPPGSNYQVGVPRNGSAPGENGRRWSLDENGFTEDRPRR